MIFCCWTVVSFEWEFVANVLWKVLNRCLCVGKIGAASSSNDPEASSLTASTPEKVLVPGAGAKPSSAIDVLVPDVNPSSSADQLETPGILSEDSKVDCFAFLVLKVASVLCQVFQTTSMRRLGYCYRSLLVSKDRPPVL